MHLSSNEIKRLLKKWHFYKAHTSTSADGSELARKISAIEKAIATLEDDDKTIIKLKYFQGVEVDIIKDKVFLSRAAVYKRIEKTVDEIAYLVANTN